MYISIKMNEKTLKDIIQTRKILKSKFRAVKLGEDSVKKTLEKTFSPITYPLKELLKTPKAAFIKEEGVSPNVSMQKYRKMETSTPMKRYDSTLKSNDSASTEDATIREMPSENDSDNLSTDNYESANEEGNESKYFDIYTTSDLNDLGRQKRLDTTYGPHKDSSDNWRFGNSFLDMQGDKIIIGSRKWSTTPGLLQLLFYKSPKGYDKTELSIYKSILLETNAYRRNFEAEGGIKGTNSIKYRNIIKPLISTPKSTYEGGGLMTLSDKKPNYIYWDDPNELVERLRLLISSQSAGHNNHINEITSIIEELKEANIIQ